MAEYFRDQEKQNVLLFIDNIFRYVQAGSEVSALLGRMPSPLVIIPLWKKKDGVLKRGIIHPNKISIPYTQFLICFCFI